MSHYRIDHLYREFVEQELLTGLPITPAQYWQTLEQLLDTMMPRNKALLETRSHMQQQIDQWHVQHPDAPQDQYITFLRDIGYLLPEGEDFTIETRDVDPEVAHIAAPQLVVPISNARYTLNALNARYGSLYDALYGTDALPLTQESIQDSASEKKGLNVARAQQVIDYCREWLDTYFPLQHGSHKQVTRYRVEHGALVIESDHGSQTLQDRTGFVGSIASGADTVAIVLRHHGLHVIIRLDAAHPIGQLDKAAVCDIELEAALTTIVDMEDSIAAVDAGDKVHAYRHWLQLMQQRLSTNFTRGGKTVERNMASDEAFTTYDQQPARLRKRALLWIRNVGHLMTTPMVTDQHGNEVGEGLIDAITSVAAGMHDLQRDPTQTATNSTCGSLYIVKPKMHGPEEVSFTNDIFCMIEQAFGLAPYTVKIGIMDEERRTSANLKECIRAAKHRVAFINTGFLDRTGDEIHTAMHAGAFPPKGDIKGKDWLQAYEKRNVTIGLACGLHGKAQIGKGMWSIPDRMAAMMVEKVAHPQAGANCAWVPSPTAATLHALHYHQVDVLSVQRQLRQQPISGDNHLSALLRIPLLAGRNLSHDEIRQEANNNAQGILGYVVRWINDGVGCSKVPDIHNVGMMEDRATCRISSQILANWLLHGLVSESEMLETLKRMAVVVDQQNKDEPGYRPMAPDYDGFAFKAACNLVFNGAQAPSGYTEPTLHAFRQQHKALE